MIERRAVAPLVPFRIFRLPALLASNVAGVLFGAAVYGTFFIITLYLQQVLGYSPLDAGLAWLALSVTALVTSIGGAQLVTRIGPRRPLVAGLAIAAVGIGLLSRLPVEASYVRDLLPALIVSGIGSAWRSSRCRSARSRGSRNAIPASPPGWSTPPSRSAARSAWPSSPTIAVSRSEDVLAADPRLSPAAALTEGFGDALLAGAAFAVVGALLAAVLIRRPVSRVAVAVDPQNAAPESAITG